MKVLEKKVIDIDYSTNFVILIYCHNSFKSLKNNLTKILKQEYPMEKYRIIYIDDASNDETSQFIKSSKFKTLDIAKIDSIETKSKSGIHKLLFNAMKQCDNDEVCVFLKAEDMIIEEKMLSTISHVYKNNNTDSVYDNYSKTNSHNTHSRKQLTEKNLNKYFNGLTTFKASLFKKLSMEDVQAEGNWLDISSTVDLSLALSELSDQTIFIKNITTSIYKPEIPKEFKKIYVDYVKKSKPLNPVT